MKIENAQNREREREPSGLRLKIYSGVVLLIIGLLMFRLVQMQLFGQDQYTEEAYGNAVRQRISEPARGLIYDRHGDLLVDNQPTYTLLVTPRYFNETQLPLLARLIGQEDSIVRVRYDRLVQRSRFQEGVLFDRIPFEAFARIQEQSWRFTGINFEIGQRRRYHTQANAAHVLGYLREITERQLEIMRPQGYDLGMVVGQTGVEREYETVLRGRPGREFVLVNTHGMEVTRFRGGEDDIPPQSGFELHLALDARVQALAESLMYRKRGGVVALDPQTGGIIAMVSAPDYDPEGWTGRMSQEFVDHVMRNPLQPLFNRATQMQQPPGSTWKVWMSLWAIEEGMINENTRLTCGGGYSLGGRLFRCLGVHGSISVRDAIRVSCNTFYYRLMNDSINGRRMDLTTWSQWARRFGFGTLAPMDYPDQSPGLIPDSSFFNRVFPAGWGPGFTINLGIGQGNMGTTPLQLARGTAAIANGGTLVDPHFVKFLLNPETGDRIEPAHRGRPTGASDRGIRIVQEGMEWVVTAGTARRVALDEYGVSMAGKTGTAQNPHGENHSVFIAYAPAENPQIAIGAIIENAGYGGTVAAPITSLMIEQYLLGEIRRPEMVERIRNIRSEGQ